MTGKALLLAAWMAFVLSLSGSTARAEGNAKLRRLAIVVGSNGAPPGRVPLRYAGTDAQAFRDALVRVGHFDAADVTLLIDPRSADVLAAIDLLAAASQDADTMAVFYYSGHSDGHLIFPHGEPLSLADLRARFVSIKSRIRLSIVDTCSGGGWTRAKGVSVGPPPDSFDIFDAQTEGSAFVASSSGLERAHEAEAIRGSFFTHHLTTGLLGAADANGDGQVSLHEAFEYARERTIRDSARFTATTQHPSFDLDLRGRQDLILSEPGAASTRVELRSANPLEIIHVGSGATVLETSASVVTVSLPPGRYIVRRVAGNTVYSDEFTLYAGDSVRIHEDSLKPNLNERIASKDSATDPGGVRSLSETLGSAHLQLGVGSVLESARLLRDGISVLAAPSQSRLLTHGRTGPDAPSRITALSASASVALDSHWSWQAPLPAFSYRHRFGGRFEVIPAAGMLGLGLGLLGSKTLGYPYSIFGGRLASVAHATNQMSLLMDSSLAFLWGDPRAGALVGSAAFNVGLAWRLNRIAFHAGVGWQKTWGERAGANEGEPTTSAYSTSTHALRFGSVQSIGFRRLPLVELSLSRAISLDLFGSLAWDLRTSSGYDEFMAGTTFLF